LIDDFLLTEAVISLERGIAIFFLLVSLVYGISAFNYPLLPFEKNMAFLPNTLPMVLSVIGIVLSLGIIFSANKGPDQRKPANYERGNVARAVLLLVSMILFALALRPLGFLLATSLFLIVTGSILGERKFHLMLPIAMFSAFLVWYLVQEVLGIFMRPWPGFLV
jgi:putative tricarboxylic transport membrane protein